MITNGKSYSLTARMRMARDIVKGMIYVHQHGVTHHDLKVRRYASRILPSLPSARVRQLNAVGIVPCTLPNADLRL